MKSATQASAQSGSPSAPSALPSQPGAQVIALRPPSRWHDPLKLIQNEAPSQTGRIVLWSVCALVLIMIVWAALGQLDIIASAEGKLVPQTLVKIVQPAEAGVVKQLLVAEGDSVRAGQVLARLDPTLAIADKAGISSDLATQLMQVRRIEAELANRPMLAKAGDAPELYAQTVRQYGAHRRAYLDGLEQEKSLLSKAEHERRSALEILSKLEQTVPTYKKAAQAYASLEKEGFFGGLAAADKQREATEKIKDLDAQTATVAALNATIAAQQQRISQLQSNYESELEKELAEIRGRVAQLQPNLDKTVYRQGLMELRAPQDGMIKDMATTTVGAVVQPGSVVLTLVPRGEQVFADVSVKNEDVGFVKVGQPAQIKLSAYPFQKYGMLTGTVVRLSADATESARGAANVNGTVNNALTLDNDQPTTVAVYKARIKLDHQSLRGPQGEALALSPGMQVVAEINQGKRSVLEYLLSPVQKAASEAGRER
ncbi:MAG: HlyD family type I secretion periplasmic adaptor subunit [Pseudomonadota bacterium]